MFFEALRLIYLRRKEARLKGRLSEKTDAAKPKEKSTKKGKRFAGKSAGQIIAVKLSFFSHFFVNFFFLLVLTEWIQEMSFERGKLFESMFESAPQMVFQIYVILVTRNAFSSDVAASTLNVVSVVLRYPTHTYLTWSSIFPFCEFTTSSFFAVQFDFDHVWNCDEQLPTAKNRSWSRALSLSDGRSRS
jgi:hypothetical protein